MFENGLNIMILGMGIVFCFLVIIYLAILLSSYFIQKFYDRVPAVAGSGGQAPQAEELAAAISAAIIYNKNIQKKR